MLIYEICFSLSYFTLYAVLCLVTVLSICDPMDYSLSDFFVHGDSPGKNTGVGYHAFLQRIFPTQGLNTLPPHCRWNTWVLNHLNHQGSPWILEWVTYPFSRGSSWLRSRTGVSCIAGGFFTSWATWEALLLLLLLSCLSLVQFFVTPCNPSGSSVHGILQARILEWVAMPSSKGSSPPRDQPSSLFCVRHWQAGSLPLASPGKPMII